MKLDKHQSSETLGMDGSASDKVVYFTVNTITDEQKLQLEKITPSFGYYGTKRWPCKVILNTGGIVENVHIFNHEAFNQNDGFFQDYWFTVRDVVEKSENFVLIEDVREIVESPNRLSPELASRIQNAGESGMGYCLSKLVLDNGQVIDVMTGSGVVDFVPLPPGITSKNIIDVLPLQGSRRNFLSGLKVKVCLFSEGLPVTYKGEIPEIKPSLFSRLWKLLNRNK